MELGNPDTRKQNLIGMFQKGTTKHLESGISFDINHFFLE